MIKDGVELKNKFYDVLQRNKFIFDKDLQVVGSFNSNNIDRVGLIEKSLRIQTEPGNKEQLFTMYMKEFKYSFVSRFIMLENDMYKAMANKYNYISNYGLYSLNSFVKVFKDCGKRTVKLDKAEFVKLVEEIKCNDLATEVLNKLYERSGDYSHLVNVIKRQCKSYTSSVTTLYNKALFLDKALDGLDNTRLDYNCRLLYEGGYLNADALINVDGECYAIYYKHLVNSFDCSCEVSNGEVVISNSNSDGSVSSITKCLKLKSVLDRQLESNTKILLLFEDDVDLNNNDDNIILMNKSTFVNWVSSKSYNKITGLKVDSMHSFVCYDFLGFYDYLKEVNNILDKDLHLDFDYLFGCGDVSVIVSVVVAADKLCKDIERFKDTIDIFNKL